MSELQDAATHLVVIGRGKLIAEMSVAELIAASSAGRVDLRTTSRDRAAALLATAGGTAAMTGPDSLTVSGLPAEQIVALLRERALSFSAVSAHQASLEEAYMEQTRDQVEFGAGAVEAPS